MPVPPGSRIRHGEPPAGVPRPRPGTSAGLRAARRRPAPGHAAPLRPLGLGEIPDASTTDIGRHPRATLGLAAAVAVVNGLVQVLVLGPPVRGRPSGPKPGGHPAASRSTWAGPRRRALQAIGGGPLTMIGPLGRGVTARDAWCTGSPLSWRLIGTAALTDRCRAASAFPPVRASSP